VSDKYWRLPTTVLYSVGLKRGDPEDNVRDEELVGNEGQV